MCLDKLFDRPKAPRPIIQQVAAPQSAPEKTDADIQKNAEQERLRRAYSTTGLSSLILTGGLGDQSIYSTRGVVLGGG